MVQSTVNYSWFTQISSDSTLRSIKPMLSCTSSYKLTKGKSQSGHQNLDSVIKKKDKLWNGVEQWATYPTPLRQFRVIVTIIYASNEVAK